MKTCWEWRGLTLVALAGCFAPTSHAQTYSGSWYNPLQSGHGLSVDQLSSDAALLLWFTYDHAGDPMPLYAETSRNDAGVFSGAAYAPHGPRFNDFDPAELVFEPWGTLFFAPASCEAATLSWAAPAFGAGNTPMRPLVSNANCAVPRMESKLSGMAGTWYHPQLQGVSLNVQVLDDESALVYWYTYDAEGKPLLLYIEARIEGQRLNGRAIAPRGMRFGTFSHIDLSVRDLGEVQLEFHDCDSATLRWNTPLGRGEQPVSRLTRLQGTRCDLPEANPQYLPVAYTGTATIDTFPFTKDKATILVGANGDLVFGSYMAGWYRGRFHREGNKLFLRFNEGMGGEVTSDPETGLIRAKIDFDLPGKNGYLLELAAEPAIQVPTDLAGVYRDVVVPRPGARASYLAIESSGRFVLAGPAGLGRGRITSFDPLTGRFVFDFRFDADLFVSSGPLYAAKRVVGLGLLRQSEQGATIRLLGPKVEGGRGVAVELLRKAPLPAH